MSTIIPRHSCLHFFYWTYLCSHPSFFGSCELLLLQAGGRHETRVHQFANPLQRTVSSQQRTLSSSYISKQLCACRTHGCRRLGKFRRMNQEYIDQGVNTCFVRLWQSHLRCKGCQASGEGDDSRGPSATMIVLAGCGMCAPEMSISRDANQ